MNLIFFALNSQNNDSLSTKKWELSADLNTYLITDNNFLLPVIRADKNFLHLEGRYNYEDFNTISFWTGYNIAGGKKIEYLITPMLGLALGQTNGLTIGLEMTFDYKKISLSSESEFLVDAESSAYNYFYTWTDFTFSPKEWMWLGISGQRTRLVQTELDIQRGIVAGVGWKRWELNAYLFNLGYTETFGLVTITFNY